MSRLVTGEFIHEDVLVDLVHTEFDQDLSEVRYLNDLFILTSTFEFGGRFGIRAENLLISQKFGAYHRQDILAGDVEGGAHTSEVVQPSIQVNDCLVHLVKRQEIG